MTGEADIARLEARANGHDTTLYRVGAELKDLNDKVSNLRVQVAQIVGAWAVLQTIATFIITR